MKTTSVTAHYERKINLGDYSSMTLGAWVTVEVEAGDDPAAALEQGMELCRAQVKATAQDALKGRAVPGVTTAEQFAGLQVNGGQS
jgi:hypothetical protein